MEDKNPLLDSEDLVDSSGEGNKFGDIPFDMEEIQVRRSEGKKKKGLSRIQGMAIAINIIIGTGVFSVPYAINKSGILFGMTGILIGGFCSFAALTFLTEVISRAQAISRVEPLNEDDPFRPRGASFIGSDSPHLKPYYAISEDLFSFSYLCRLFGGKHAALACQVIVCMYCYGSLWSYGSVFASSLISLIFEAMGEECDVYSNPSSSCNLGYKLTVVVYGLLVGVMSLFEIRDQVKVQQILTLYRFFAFFLMILTVLIGICTKPAYEDEKALQRGSPYYSLTQLWNWGGYNILTTTSVAFTVQVNFPEVIQSLKRKTKQEISFVAAGALGCATFFYLVIGLLCGLYFGDHVEPLVVLNWKDYKGYWTKDKSVASPWWAILIRVIVTMFPVFDMLSVFPLLALSLASNYYFLLEDKLLTRLSPEAAIRFCRLLAAVPPVLLAFFLSNLDQIFSYTGLCSFFLQLIIPCLLWYFALRRCYLIWTPTLVKANPYNSIFSFPGFPFGVFCFGIAAFIMSFTNIILQS